MPLFVVAPIEAESLRAKAYAAVKAAITRVDICGRLQPVRLDERSISEQSSANRTPIPEAIILLEQDGFVRTKRRRGIVIGRKIAAHDNDVHGKGAVDAPLIGAQQVVLHHGQLQLITEHRSPEPRVDRPDIGGSL